MRRLKKSMATVLAALLTLGMLAACGQKTPEVSSEETPPVTSEATASPTESDTAPSSVPLTPLEISIAWWGFSDATTEEEMKADPLFQSVCKKFNITIKPVPLTWDDYTQKIQVWATSGTLPDIFSIDAVGSQYYRDWVNQGVIRFLPMVSNYWYSDLENFEIYDEHTMNWIRRTNAEYLKVREYFSCDFYPLTEISVDEGSWCAYQFDRPEQGDGVVLIFKRPKSLGITYQFRLGGISGDKTYSFTDADTNKNFDLSGKEIQRHGFSQTIHHPRTAKLYFYHVR